MSNLDKIEKESYLTFTLGEETFTVSIHQVREILEVQKITRVPNSSAFARGILNLRGNILPVFDTRQKFGLAPVPDTLQTRIIVLDINYNQETLQVGAVVDSALDVIQFSNTEVNPPPSMEDYKQATFIKGIVKIDEDFVMLLDVNQIFSPSEIESISEMI